MIHPIPSGTRDVLPDEMGELRAITDALLGVFQASGYGEVYTPAIEYEEVLLRAGGGLKPAYRVFDLPLHPAPATATFYARHGDLFAYACWALWLAHFALGVRRRTISSPGQDRDRAA